ncbi:alpha/beta hydrolase [Streptomyces sp. NEAU-YJ-81]|uniref:alpha/beta fold hydrolase n=1 Tax=Streptomyces sp. NEAU-YJ-81 TaxID=2820288 RepID=UPI0027DFA3CA|nr:alpha/beta hydrolase [Streptomyces sp. NEAU-YJ-81]
MVDERVTSAARAVADVPVGASLAVWDQRTPALARTHRVVCWNLPGHGGSPANLLPDGGTVADLERLVLVPANTLSIDRFAYAGISLGGAVGTWLAVHHPERVTLLAVLCSSARFSGPRGWLDRVALVRARGIRPLVDTAAGRWFTPSFATAPAAEELVDDLSAAVPEVYAALCGALVEYDLRTELPRITAPTLVLAGREDPATPVAHARGLADGIPPRGPDRGDASGTPGKRRASGTCSGSAARTLHCPGHAPCQRRLPTQRRPGRTPHRPRRRVRRPGIARTTHFTADFREFITRYA